MLVVRWTNYNSIEFFKIRYLVRSTIQLQSYNSFDWNHDTCSNLVSCNLTKIVHVIHMWPMWWDEKLNYQKTDWRIHNVIFNNVNDLQSVLLSTVLVLSGICFMFQATTLERKSTNGANRAWLLGGSSDFIALQHADVFKYNTH